MTAAAGGCLASSASYADGRPVVDQGGGPTWSRRTSQVLFSASKGALALCVGLLVEKQQVEPDDPVSRYWPEFAAVGKERLTVRQLMAHEAGLPTVDGGFELDEFTDEMLDVRGRRPVRPAPSRRSSQLPWRDAADGNRV